MGKRTTADLPIRKIGENKGSRSVTITNMLKYIDAFDDEFVRVTIEKVNDNDEARDTESRE